MTVMTRAQRRKALRALYEKVPKVQCRGLCSASCGPIECSDVELETVERRAGKKLKSPKLVCSMLSSAGRCTVYGDRPMICRLYGAVPEMRCPHGCEPDREVGEFEGRELLIESLRVGGGRVADLDVTDLARLAEMLRDPELQEFYRRYVGDGMAADARKMGVPAARERDKLERWAR